MNDITFAELATALAGYPEMATWWSAVSALPVNVTVAEFFAKTMHGANRAATAKNASLAAGSRISAYPAPANGAVTIDPTTGFGSYLATFSVQARVSTDLNIAVAPNA